MAWWFPTWFFHAFLLESKIPTTTFNLLYTRFIDVCLKCVLNFRSFVSQKNKSVPTFHKSTVFCRLWKGFHSWSRHCPWQTGSPNHCMEPHGRKPFVEKRDNLLGNRRHIYIYYGTYIYIYTYRHSLYGFTNQNLAVVDVFRIFQKKDSWFRMWYIQSSEMVECSLMW